LSFDICCLFGNWYFKIENLRSLVLRTSSLLFLTIKMHNSILNYSKAPRGLFVLVEVGRVFTAIAISPSKGLRQLLARYAFRAGRNFNIIIHFREELDYIFILLKALGVLVLYISFYRTHSSCKTF